MFDVRLFATYSTAPLLLQQQYKTALPTGTRALHACYTTRERSEVSSMDELVLVLYLSYKLPGKATSYQVQLIHDTRYNVRHSILRSWRQGGPKRAKKMFRDDISRGRSPT